jgi:hypothetical protein
MTERGEGQEKVRRRARMEVDQFNYRKYLFINRRGEGAFKAPFAKLSGADADWLPAPRER